MGNVQDQKGRPADDTATKKPAHLPDDLKFQPGQSGNPRGRPKGARSKLSEAFLEALAADFHKHGPEVIQTVRTEKPDVYVKVIASILPRDLNVNVNDLGELSDEALRVRILDMEAAIRPFLDADACKDAHVVDGGDCIPPGTSLEDSQAYMAVVIPPLPPAASKTVEGTHDGR